MTINQKEMIIPAGQMKLQQLKDDLFIEKQVKVIVASYTCGHAELNGNKWYKLKYNLLEAKQQNKKTLLTFGGAWSNHITATACAAKLSGFKSIGIIRGELSLPLNKTLARADEQGMQLVYVTRENYRQKEEEQYIEDLKTKFGDFYLVPEGGSNSLGLKGCTEIVADIHEAFDYICCACGTGTTLAGILLSLKAGQQAIGVQVLKGKGYISGKINELVPGIANPNNLFVTDDYHFGGYAKVTAELADYIDLFYKKHGIRIEPVYTGKLFYALEDLIRNNYFKPGSVIMALHTGGLQYL